MSKRISDRRNLSSSMSADVLRFLADRGHSDEEIARLLGSSKAFVSLVGMRERVLMIEHLERLADELSMPMGAMMLAINPLPEGATEDAKRRFELTSEIMAAADRALAQLKRRTASGT